MKSNEKKLCLPIFSKIDSLDGVIYVCPHCYRYVMGACGVQICKKCSGRVDNDYQIQYEGNVKFDGDESWERV